MLYEGRGLLTTGLAPRVHCLMPRLLICSCQIMSVQWLLGIVTVERYIESQLVPLIMVWHMAEHLDTMWLLESR